MTVNENERITDFIIRYEKIFTRDECRDIIKHIDFFDDIMEAGKVNPRYFLKDGLHFNENGYNVLKNHLKPHL